MPDLLPSSCETKARANLQVASEDKSQLSDDNLGNLEMTCRVEPFCLIALKADDLKLKTNPLEIKLFEIRKHDVDLTAV